MSIKKNKFCLLKPLCRFIYRSPKWLVCAGAFQAFLQLILIVCW
jgi:hypothetical protein